MSAVVYFAHGARVRAICFGFRGVVLLSILDSKRLSQTDVWHHSWHRGGFYGTVFGTGDFAIFTMQDSGPIIFFNEMGLYSSLNVSNMYGILFRQDTVTAWATDWPGDNQL
jgi:hypothetical protein